MLKSMATVVWSLIMIAFVLLLFALLFIQAVTEYRLEMEDPDLANAAILVKYFGSVGATVLALFQTSTGGVDWGDVYDLVSPAGPFYYWMFLAFIVMFQLAVFNVITSIYVDKARKLLHDDPETSLKEKLAEESLEKSELRNLVRSLDIGEDGNISYEELETKL